MREYIKLKGVVKFSQGIQIPIEDQSLNKMNGSVRFVRIVDYTKSGGEPPRYINSCNDKYLVNDEDVVMIRYGSKTAGQVARGISGAIANNMFQIKILDESKLDKNYLYWYLAQESTYQRLNGSQSSSTMPAITFGMIGDFEIPVLDIKDQKRLSEMFSVYENLIEKNNRRITILEDMAQSLYREWFVHFRYPGHAVSIDADGKQKFIESPLDQIPEGWKVKTLKDLLELAYGKALKKPDRKGGSVAVYGSGGVGGYHDKSLVDGPCIIVGRKGNVGKTFWVDKNCWPIDTVFYVKSEFSKFYLYYNLLHQRFFNSDAAVPGLNRESAYSNKIIIPSAELVTKFDEFIKPIFKQRYLISKANENLKQQRDMLLPKLISGQIELKD
jgi:type I restriction enzyme S subunit